MKDIFADVDQRGLTTGAIRRCIEGLDWESDLYHGPIEMSGALPRGRPRRSRRLPRGVVDQEPWDSYGDFLISVRTQPSGLNRIDDLEHLFFDPETSTTEIPDSFYITNKGIIKAIAWAFNQSHDNADQDDRDYYVCQGLWLFGGQAQQQKVVYPEDLQPFEILAGVNDRFWAETKQPEPVIVSLVSSSDEEASERMPPTMCITPPKASREGSKSQYQSTPIETRKGTRSSKHVLDESLYIRRKPHNHRLLTDSTRTGRTRVDSGRVTRRTINSRKSPDRLEIWSTTSGGSRLLWSSNFKSYTAWAAYVLVVAVGRFFHSRCSRPLSASLRDVARPKHK